MLDGIIALILVPLDCWIIAHDLFLLMAIR